jgi:uracil-DNA glycosylase
MAAKAGAMAGAARACNSDTDSGAPSCKCARQEVEHGVSAVHHAGVSRETAVDLDEDSRSIGVAEETSDTTLACAQGSRKRDEAVFLAAGVRTRPEWQSSCEALRSPGRRSPASAHHPAIGYDGRRSNNSRVSQCSVSSAMTSSRWLADLITSPEWRAFLQPITADSWRGGAFTKIEHFLDEAKERGKVVLPPAHLIFNAFNSCPFAELKVVLLGQDPYHNLNQAHGLCFSVLPGVPLPPSLKNMYKELTTDIPGFQAPTHGYLQSWSEQGMLMLNATLTVEAHNANSHSKTSGWPDFTDAVIERLSRHHPSRLVFLLWGNSAQQKRKLIDTSRHVVIESVHPSPLSASKGWFGCHCFSKCNAALRELGHTPMYWQLPLVVRRTA